MSVACGCDNGTAAWRRTGISRATGTRSAEDAASSRATRAQRCASFDRRRQQCQRAASLCLRRAADILDPLLLLLLLLLLTVLM